MENTNTDIAKIESAVTPVTIEKLEVLAPDETNVSELENKVDSLSDAINSLTASVEQSSVANSSIINNSSITTNAPTSVVENVNNERANDNRQTVLIKKEEARERKEETEKKKQEKVEIKKFKQTDLLTKAISSLSQRFLKSETKKTDEKNTGFAKTFVKMFKEKSIDTVKQTVNAKNIMNSVGLREDGFVGGILHALNDKRIEKKEEKAAEKETAKKGAQDVLKYTEKGRRLTSETTRHDEQITELTSKGRSATKEEKETLKRLKIEKEESIKKAQEYGTKEYNTRTTRSKEIAELEKKQDEAKKLGGGADLSTEELQKLEKLKLEQNTQFKTVNLPLSKDTPQTTPQYAPTSPMTGANQPVKDLDPQTTFAERISKLRENVLAKSGAIEKATAQTEETLGTQLSPVAKKSLEAGVRSGIDEELLKLNEAQLAALEKLVDNTEETEEEKLEKGKKDGAGNIILPAAKAEKEKTSLLETLFGGMKGLMGNMTGLLRGLSGLPGILGGLGKLLLTLGGGGSALVRGAGALASTVAGGAAKAATTVAGAAKTALPALAKVAGPAAAVAAAGAAGYAAGKYVVNPLLDKATQTITGDKNDSFGTGIFKLFNDEEKPQKIQDILQNSRLGKTTEEERKLVKENTKIVDKIFEVDPGAKKAWEESKGGTVVAPSANTLRLMKEKEAALKKKEETSTSVAPVEPVKGTSNTTVTTPANAPTWADDVAVDGVKGGRTVAPVAKLADTAREVQITELTKKQMVLVDTQMKREMEMAEKTSAPSATVINNSNISNNTTQNRLMPPVRNSDPTYNNRLNAAFV